MASSERSERSLAVEGAEIQILTAIPRLHRLRTNYKVAVRLQRKSRRRIIACGGDAGNWKKNRARGALAVISKATLIDTYGREIFRLVAALVKRWLSSAAIGSPRSELRAGGQRMMQHQHLADSLGSDQTDELARDVDHGHGRR